MNIQEAYRTPNRLDQKRNSSHHIIIKTPNAQNKEIILKAVRGKDQVSYKGRPIKIIPDSSQETMKARRSWADLIQTRRKNKCHPMLLYPSKFSITIEGENKIFHDKKTNQNNICPQIQPYRNFYHHIIVKTPIT